MPLPRIQGSRKDALWLLAGLCVVFLVLYYTYSKGLADAATLPSADAEVIAPIPDPVPDPATDSSDSADFFMPLEQDLDASTTVDEDGSPSTSTSIPQVLTTPHTRLMQLKYVHTASKFAEQFMSASAETALLSSLKDRALPALPPSIHLWQARVGVSNQGPWGACTAFAMRYAIVGTAAAKAASASTPLPPEPSKAWIYAQSRRRNGDPLSQDTGSTNAATVAVVRSGVATETSVPYYATNILMRTSAAASAVLGAPLSRPSSANPLAFVAVPFGRNATATLMNVKTRLAAKNFVIVAIACFRSFTTLDVLLSGTIPLPSSADVAAGALGGHAIALCGYDDARQLFYFMNSWGQECGFRGQFSIPYAYISNPNFCGDMWSPA